MPGKPSSMGAVGAPKPRLLVLISNAGLGKLQAALWGQPKLPGAGLGTVAPGSPLHQALAGGAHSV